MDVWLASQSPRRLALLSPLFPNLEQSGLAHVDETPPSGTVEHQVLTICQRKAKAVPDDGRLVIVADTMLSDPDDHSLSLGKPRDKGHAATMLYRIIGRHHQVWTATGVRWGGQWRFWCESAIVSIPDLDDDILAELLDSESWVGKAGAYDLHGAMGQYASLVEGEEATVLGLAGQAWAHLEALASLQ